MYTERSWPHVSSTLGGLRHQWIVMILLTAVRSVVPTAPAMLLPFQLLCAWKLTLTSWTNKVGFWSLFLRSTFSASIRRSVLSDNTRETLQWGKQRTLRWTTGPFTWWHNSTQLLLQLFPLSNLLLPWCATFLSLKQQKIKSEWESRFLTALSAQSRLFGATEKKENAINNESQALLNITDALITTIPCYLTSDNKRKDNTQKQNIIQLLCRVYHVWYTMQIKNICNFLSMYLLQQRVFAPTPDALQCLSRNSSEVLVSLSVPFWSLLQTE